ncbi:MAG: PqqD family protein [candidate division WS1 bacterium]|nr:PqqD family protein [candidate division WS1 bacterium]
MSMIPDVSGTLERLGLRKGQRPLSREQAFEARPVRNPRLKWRLNDDENAEVIVPRRKDVFGRVMGFLFFVPESRPIVLDEVGSRVWELCDGEHTVDEMIRVLSNEYKLGRREVEVSLTEYLRTLGKRGMVGFLVPKEFLDEEDAGELVGLQDIGSTREDLEAARAEAAQIEAEQFEAERAREKADEIAASADDEDQDEPADSQTS